MDLYPLTFVPRFVEKIWGGRKLQTVLDKPIPPHKQIGESWELYDFPPGVVEKSDDWLSSVIANGPLAGRTLHSLMVGCEKDLLGSVSPVGPHRQFPLLLKFLDAREDLSVQVHPSPAYASLHPDAHLKSEAWYVIESNPVSRLFIGLQPGTTLQKFEAAARSGSVEQHLGTIPVEAGDCVYLPSGTVHALGAGILAAEVQTPSDTTFRVYDFNRIDDSTGKPRMLHVEQAMQCIDFENCLPPQKQRGEQEGRLVSSPFFRMTKRSAVANSVVTISGGRPIMLIGLAGNGEVASGKNSHGVEIVRGSTMLIPAALGESTLRARADCSWLQIEPESTNA